MGILRPHCRHVLRVGLSGGAAELKWLKIDGALILLNGFSSNPDFYMQYAACRLYNSLLEPR